VKLQSSFLFVCCQPGAEPLLKEELAREAPRLRFAFSRPGFLTFKDVESRPFSPNLDIGSVFARSFGLSIGSCKSDDPASEVIEHARALREAAGVSLRLHVWERPLHVPGEEPPGFERGKDSARIEAALRTREPALFSDGVEARHDETVLDVIVMEPGAETSPLFVGFHRQSGRHHAFPGGEFPIETPEGMPSRAFVKMEQALRWGRVPLQQGDAAVELGAAPGGASFALLLRGLEVWGIDPGAMDPVVWTDPRCEKRFHHVKKAFSDLKREDLPKAAQWVALDINGPVRVSLPYIEQLVGWFQESLLGCVLTFKINDPKHARHIPEWLETLQGLGLKRLRATQLPANKREICVVALTGKGLLRVSGPKKGA
jgi:23S rRNA (cytidine2498-2'-O)-methyltransferase